MLMSGRIIPTIGEPSAPWSFDSALDCATSLPFGTVLALLGVSFSLQIENQGLVEFDLSVILDPFDFNWFMLCPSAMSFFEKLCPAPSNWAHSVVSTEAMLPLRLFPLQSSRGTIRK